MSSSRERMPNLRAVGLVVAASFGVASASVFAQFPDPLAVQVADLETTGEPLLIPGPIMGSFFEVWGSAPSQLFALGDELAFVADDRLHGAEVWITDGSTEGTRLLADICSGS